MMDCGVSRGMATKTGSPARAPYAESAAPALPAGGEYVASPREQSRVLSREDGEGSPAARRSAHIHEGILRFAQDLLPLFGVLNGLVEVLLKIVHRLLGLAVLRLVLAHLGGEGGELVVVLLEQLAVVFDGRVGLGRDVVAFLRRLRVLVEHLLGHGFRLLVLRLVVGLLRLLA